VLDRGAIAAPKGAEDKTGVPRKSLVAGQGVRASAKPVVPAKARRNVKAGKGARAVQSGIPSKAQHAGATSHAATPSSVPQQASSGPAPRSNQGKTALAAAALGASVVTAGAAEGAPAPGPAAGADAAANAGAAAAAGGNVETARAAPPPGSATNRLPARPARSQPSPLPGDDALVAARNAFLGNEANRLESIAAAIDFGHPLRQHVDAWRLRLQMNDARFDADATVRGFLDRFAGSAAADAVRRDWLLSLAKRGHWNEFEQQYGRWPARADDPQPGCADARRRALQGDAVALAAARDALPLFRELGEACTALLEQLAGQGALSQADLWRRLLAAADAGNLAAVRRIATFLPSVGEARALNAALDQPQAEVLVAPNANSRDLVALALGRLARNDPLASAERLMRVGPRLADEDRAWAWAQVAAAGARKLMPEAADWARRGAIVPGAGLPYGLVSDETLAALARAGLRVRDWALVRGAIERMSETGQADPTWRYWLAKAMLAGGRPDEAAAHFRAIASPWNFYGLLAAEEIGQALTLPARPPSPTDEEVAEVLSQPGVARALKFAQLNLRPESVREMAFTIRSLSDRQLVVLAEALRRRGLYDRSIAVADRTATLHDAELRYPTPFRELVSAAARAQELDPAFVYGLVRQESRFLPEARSGVGAAGLMQLMPATAKWVARKVGANDFSPGRIHDPDLNIRFGSYYLRRVLNELDGSPMLAAAAYNAGPGRPKAWRASLPVAIEGAAFAETIPFNETRDYVKKVLANTVAYSALLEGRGAAGRIPSLKARLGQITPRAAIPGEAP